MNEKKVVLVLACDCDPLCFAAERRKSPPEHWELTGRTLKALVTRLKRILPHGQALKVTFLIRSDAYMHEAFGEYAYCARVSRDFLDGLRSAGHEIGWHPHLWRWFGKWLAELNDTHFMEDCLVNGFNALRDHFEVTSVRTGWDFMSNEFMEVLESLGLERDFSALPGIRYQEAVQRIAYDWMATPTRFYFPSRDDYRRPGLSQRFKVLEMPITITETPMPVRWIRPLLDRFCRAERSTNRYEPMNIAKHFVFNKNAFDKVLNEREGGYMLTYFHPSDIIASLGMFSLQNLEGNIKYLMSRCREQKTEFSSMTAAEAARDFLTLHCV